MDDESPARSPTVRAGGTVEPLDRAKVAKDRFQTPNDLPAERYELRDPFAETTYRSDSFAQMAAKADQMGSSRFSAIDAQGNRTPVLKTHGHWEKDVPHQTPRHVTEAAKEPAKAPETTTPSTPHKATAAPEVERSTVKIDAQAERVALLARLQAGLQERYVIKRPTLATQDMQVGQTEYRFRGDTSRIAFTETTFRLATDTNSPSVARSMVDVAEARNWKALRVSGNEDFRRLVWLEASVRGVKLVGYEPTPADLDQLKSARESRLVNRVEPTAETTAAAASKATGRGGGRKAVLAAIDAILVAKGVSSAQREAVLVAATEQLAARTRAGQSIKVKVLDRTAPAQRPPVVTRPEPTRSRDRAAPTR